MLITCYGTNFWSKAELAIADNVTVVNQGEIDIQSGSKLSIKGVLENSGFVGSYNDGSFSGKKLNGNGWNEFDGAALTTVNSEKKLNEALSAGEKSTIVGPADKGLSQELYELAYVWVRLPQDSETNCRIGLDLSDLPDNVTYVGCAVQMYK